MKAFREFLAHSAAFVVVLGLFLLFMWGLMEGTQLLPRAFERPTPTMTATAATPVPSTPTMGLISELGEPLPPRTPSTPMTGGDMRLRHLDPERLLNVGGQERYDWVRASLP